MLHLFLRDLRVNAGLSRAEVARRLGVSRTTAYSWERDPERAGHPPDPPQLQALLDLFSADDTARLEAWRLRADASKPATEHRRPRRRRTTEDAA